MIIFQSVFGWISTILSICCLVWCVGLLVFVLVKAIINKVRAKREQKEMIQGHNQFRERKFGNVDRRKKGK